MGEAPALQCLRNHIDSLDWIYCNQFGFYTIPGLPNEALGDMRHLGPNLRGSFGDSRAMLTAQPGS